MSTNFYADWRISENVTVRLHIGKRVRESISTFSGTTFPTLDAWKTFLRHNVNTVQVVSEYSEPYETERFITEEIDKDPNGSQRQIQWLREHGYTIHNTPVPPTLGQPVYWLDGERLFYSGEFS